MTQLPRFETFLVITATAGLLSACATSPQVSVERAPGNALARYETFAVRPDASTSVSDPAFGPAARRAAQEEVELALSRQGYRLVDPEDAEVLVTVSATTATHAESGDVTLYPGDTAVQTRETGLRTPVGTIPTGSQTTVVQTAPSVSVDPVSERTERTIVVDVFDAETRELLWRGTSTMRRASSKRIDDGALRERVRAIAARFPAS